MRKLMREFNVIKATGIGYLVGWLIAIIVYTIIAIGAGLGNKSCLNVLTKINNRFVSILKRTSSRIHGIFKKSAVTITTRTVDEREVPEFIRNAAK